jgi:glycosyltransferase involved in cell wall biosynthesis
LRRLEKEIEFSEDPSLREELETYRHLEPLLWAVSDVIYYPAEEECEFVRRRYPSKTVRQFPIFFYDEKELAEGITFAREHRAGLPQIIFVGGFRHRPNVHAIVWFCEQVFPIVRRACKDASLKVVGSFPPSSVQNLQGSGIEVTGFVSEERLRSLYRSSSVSIAPLRFGGGVKGKIIEALRFGVPVVTTAIGLGGISGGSAFMKVADEPNDFADAIIELLRNEELRHRLANQGLEFLSEHYSRQSVRDMLALDFPELAPKEQ